MTRIFSKPQLQQVLRDLRKAGYTVTFDGHKYEVFIDGAYGEKPVLVALNGTRGYLVTYHESLLTAQEA